MLGMVPGLKRRGGQEKQWIDGICKWTSASETALTLLNGRIPKALSETIPELVSLARDSEVWGRAVHDFANPALRVG